MTHLTILLSFLIFPLGSSFGLISKRERTSVINQSVDAILEDFASLVRTGGVEEMRVHDMNYKFKKKIKYISLSGGFKARNGTVKDISTIQRTGDALRTVTATAVTLQLSLGLRDLRVSYGDFQAKLDSLRASGDIQVLVGANSVFLQFTVTFEDENTCSVVLDKVSIQELDDIQVEISAVSSLDWIFERVTELILMGLKDDLEESIEQSLASVARKKGSNSKFCAMMSIL